MDCSTPGFPVLHSCPLSWCHHPTISSSVIPFSWLQSFPALRSFPMSWLFGSGGKDLDMTEWLYVLSLLKVKVKVKALSRVLLCDPLGSLPGSSVHGTFQAIVLEWIAISFSRGSSWPRDRTQVSHIVDRRLTVWATREVLTQSLSLIQIFATLWTVAHQDPLSMEFSRQEYWSGLLFPTPGDLLDPGIKLWSLASPALADGFFTTQYPGSPFWILLTVYNMSISFVKIYSKCAAGIY